MHAVRSTLLAVAAATTALHAADPLPGHSTHGEAFNDGPRQAAVLIGGTGKLDFPVTTAKTEAQKFFAQGVGQLHGFWYYEAERSFRQAASIDPECAMAYWGMAMANVNNEKRAKEFLKKAVALKPKAGAKEKLWIGAWETFYKEDKRDKKQRALDLIKDLETIVQDYPGDIEAKAFLAWKIWHAKDDAPMSSSQAVDALLDQVFAANPDHPAHHYRIHLWDSGGKPARALKSAAVLGQSAPAIAHMWHMPGHTYSKLRRFDDAAWQQEASTRVDHAYMMANLVLPDQIHNYAHNEEWLVRTFNELGRAKDAIALAKSLIALPRHPTFNSLDKTTTSAGYGRTRLLETLVKWEMWEEILRETQDRYLGAVTQVPHEAARLRAIGAAQYHFKDVKALADAIRSLEALEKREAEEAKKEEAKAEAKKQDAKKPKEAPKNAAKALAELRALRAILLRKEDAAKLLADAKDLPKDRQARLWLDLGDKKKAEEVAKTAGPELAPLAAKAEVLAAVGKVEDAKKAFAEVRKLAFDLDSDLPLVRRLTVLANSFGIEGEWRNAAPKRTDSGKRPALASLGPIHWQPPHAPKWEALTLDGKAISAEDCSGKPTLLLFYLGSSCTHCMTQINAFAKVNSQFEQSGIQLVGITREPMSTAGQVAEQMDSKKMPPFAILCDPSLAAFKAFRAYDDFEGEALHAAVLIDGNGLLRWLDISWEPFTNTSFLLDEAKRLLNLPAPAPGT
jgi:peroxiredoxin